MAKNKTDKKKKECPRKRLKSHVPMLQVLKSASPKLRKAIIYNAQPSLITSISECSLNVLNGNERISPQCKQALTKYKGELRKLASPHHRVSIKKKKEILTQRGGFIVPLLGTILGGLLSKLV